MSKDYCSSSVAAWAVHQPFQNLGRHFCFSIWNREGRLRAGGNWCNHCATHALDDIGPLLKHIQHRLDSVCRWLSVTYDTAGKHSVGT